jgi:curli biogenesis system outer membrane secretion channel CsgG
MATKTLVISAIVVLATSLASNWCVAQTTAASTQVDDVIKLFKGGMSEGLIIESLRKKGQPTDLSPADLLKLKEASVPESIMQTMMDPKSGPPAVAPAKPAVVNPASAISSTNGQKKRVVVYTFEYKPKQEVGEAIRSMLQNRLAEQGQVVVVERAQIDAIEAELKRNAGGMVQAGTGAQIGRISGVDAVLAGDVIIFGRDDKKHTAGAAVTSDICTACSVFTRTKTEEKAVVAINYRFIDAETSEVVATGEARGESKRTSKSWGGGTGSKSGSVDVTVANFAETIVGEATMDCVNKLAALFTQQVQGMKRKRHELEAYVADISDNTMVITAGTNDGVVAGDVFEICKIDRVLRDPNTKEVLDRVVTKVGECTISSVRERVATGAYVGSPAENGFLARKKL